MKASLKIISNTTSLITIALAVVGVAVMLQSQNRLVTLHRDISQANRLRLLAAQSYGHGLQLGQATRNVVLSPTDTKAVKNHAQAAESLRAVLAELAALAAPDIRTNLTALQQAIESDLALQREVQNLAQTQRGAEAVQLLATRETPQWRACKELIFTVEQWCEKAVQELATKAETQSRLTRTTLWIMGGLLVLTPVCSSLTNRRGLRGAATAVASVAEVATNVTTAAAEMTRMGQTLAQQSTEQAASLEETSASLEELSSMARRNAASAERVSVVAQQARAAADLGLQETQRMSAAMGAIQTSSDGIAKVLKSIDEIAFQTNLLALNAAVEAARAGEAGQGFAIVADEVRSLAQRSAESARSTATQIEQALASAAQGNASSARVNAQLGEIATKARQVEELAGEVVAASREQNQGIQQINQAVAEIDRSTQSNSASSEEAVSVATSFQSETVTLQSAVNQLSLLIGAERKPS